MLFRLLLIIPLINPVANALISQSNDSLAYVHFLNEAQQQDNDPNQKLRYLDSAYFYLEALSNETLLLQFRPVYADQLLRQGYLDPAARQLQLTTTFCQENPEKADCEEALQAVYSAQANLQKSLGNLDKALEFLDLTRQSYRDEPIDRALLDTYVEEASILDRVGKYEDIMTALDAGLALAKQGNLSWQIGRFYRLKASYNIDYLRQDSIVSWLDQAEGYLKREADTTDILELDMTKSRFYYSLGEFELVINTLTPYMHRCASDAPNSVFCRNACYFLAMSYDTLQAPEEALYYANLSVKMHEQFNDKTLLRMSYLTLSWIQYKQNRMEDAYFSLYDANNLADTVFRNDLEVAMANERTRQQVQAVEEARQVAEAQSALLKTQNRLWLGLNITFGALLLGGGILVLLLQKARARLRESNQQLVALNATKDKFFGLIAHDLRSPVVALSSVGDQMQWYLEQDRPDKISRLANRVAETSRGLNRLLDNLLQWALLQTGMLPYYPEHFPIEPIIAENITLYQGAATVKNISIQSSLAPELNIYADPVAVSTIVRNLLNNALKFTPSGGQIDLEATSTKDGISLKIIDTGVGMTHEQRDHIFQLERKSTKGTAGERGAGLGLVLVKELITLNQGKIEVHSEVGEGSCFEIILPGSRF